MAHRKTHAACQKLLVSIPWINAEDALPGGSISHWSSIVNVRSDEECDRLDSMFLRTQGAQLS
jgi:hypothetical protein